MPSFSSSTGVNVPTEGTLFAANREDSGVGVEAVVVVEDEDDDGVKVEIEV
jgi:hypothetical protein